MVKELLQDEDFQKLVKGTDTVVKEKKKTKQMQHQKCGITQGVCFNCSKSWGKKNLKIVSGMNEYVCAIGEGVKETLQFEKDD